MLPCCWGHPQACPDPESLLERARHCRSSWLPRMLPEGSIHSLTVAHTILRCPWDPGGSWKSFFGCCLEVSLRGFTTLPLGGVVICFLPEKARELEKESWREQESEKRWAGSIMTLIIQLLQLWQRELHCSRELEPAAPSPPLWSGPLWPTPLLL